jgi:thiol-disulfide isomerase/thioredoxin
MELFEGIKMKLLNVFSIFVLFMASTFTLSSFSVAALQEDANKIETQKSQTGKSSISTVASDNEKALWEKIKDADAQLAQNARSNQPIPPFRDANEAEIKAYYKASEEFQKGQFKYVVNILELAKQYYLKYPAGLYADENRNYLVNSLRAVTYLNDNTIRPQDSSLSQQLFADKNLSADQANELLIMNYMIAMNLKQKLQQGDESVKKEYSDMLTQMERWIIVLEKRFKGNMLIADTCLSFADDISDTDLPRARRLLEVLKKDADEKEKALIDGMLNRIGIVGSKPDIKFKAVDGKEVSLQNLHGKVVLVDFWATWCGPCIQELPNVLKTYKKYHNQGFEIIGITFDKDLDTLKKFTKANGMTWPQYFDGKVWDNELGKFYGIRGIPAMWLVDKEGKVVDINARTNLSAKVAKMLGVK